MIRRLGSDLESFKTLTFGPGLNVLLADKSEGATDRQSRNGAGKTSVIELVHFLCGSNADKKSIFRSEALIDASFNMTVQVGDEEYVVERCGRKPSRITITGAETHWPIPPKPLLNVDTYELSNENWRHTLGHYWFGLNAPPKSNGKYFPTFRALFSYFARRQGSGGFQTPTQNATMQQIWDQQVAMSYLLDLDWRISSEIQLLRDKEKVVKALGRAARTGDLGPHFERAADLRTRLAVASRRTELLRTELQAFQVVPEFQLLEVEANELTRKINGLGEENFVDRRLVSELQASLQEEAAPDNADLMSLYKEAGIVLPDLLNRHFEEVAVFHRTIIANRRSHLAGEITSAEQRILARETEKLELDIRRGQIMDILQSGGALEQYTAMREELGRAEADVQTLRQRLETAEALESSKAELEIERNQLTRSLRNDVHERTAFVDEAILKFEELSEALYERAGSLTVDAGPAGPTFEVKIEKQRSKGITNMQIFCFDLMLLELNYKKGRSPGFLIHDSHLFDGVDERQVANALQLGAHRAEANDFQYLVTMNSDALPSDGFRSGFDIRKYIVRTRLTDATETGGLFGTRF